MKPPGSIVGITIDGDPNETIEPGEAVVTTTGRTYIVVEARRQPHGKHAGRWHVRCLVHDTGPPAGVRVHKFFWYRRERRR
jgi:hypothetical protein